LSHSSTSRRTAARAATISSSKKAGVFAREKRRLTFPRREVDPRDASARNRQKAHTFGRFSVRAQPPGAKMAVREKRLTRDIQPVKPYPTPCGPFFSATIPVNMPSKQAFLSVGPQGARYPQETPSFERSRSASSRMLATCCLGPTRPSAKAHHDRTQTAT
jgi:hypothetical protein